VFDEFDRAALPWVLLRGEGDLARPDGDVDLLIDPAAAPRAMAILKRLEFIRIPTAGRGSHRLYIGYDPASSTWIKLDLVTTFGFGPHFSLRAPLADGCLRRRRLSTFPVLSADDAFWSLLLHCLVDSRSISPKYVDRLRKLASSARADSEWTKIFDSPASAAPRSRSERRPFDPESIIAAANAEDWRGLERLAPVIERRWLRRQFVSAIGRWVVGVVGSVLEPGLAFVKRRGLTVAVLGPDGAGKSSLAAGITRVFPFPSRRIYMGLWGSKQRTGATAPGLDLMCKLVTAWRRYAVGQYHRALGRLVIFDRYPYDARVDDRRGDPLRDRLYFAILGASCPPADLTLVLDVPGEIAFARKREHAAAALEQRRHAYRRLPDLIRGAEIVDAARPAEEVRQEALARIWRHMTARS
jgi:thymidylate kinase